MKASRKYFIYPLAALAALMTFPVTAADINFTDVTIPAGADQTPHRESYGASWGDLDGDGYPDLFVSNHWTPKSIFLNTGDGKFIDVGSQVKAFADNPKADTHGGAWFDFNNDGSQDLLVSKGHGGPPLMLVNKRGMLVDEAKDLGLTSIWEGRMPIWLDYNGDGLPDLVMSIMGVVNADGSRSAIPVPVLKQVKGQGFVLDPEAVDGECVKQQYGQLLYNTDEARLDFLCPSGGVVFPRRIYNTLPSPWQVLTSLFPTTPVLSSFPGTPGVPPGADSVIADFNNDGRMDIFVLSGMDSRPSGAVISQDGTVIEAGLSADGRGFTFKGSGSVTFKISSQVFYETDLNSTWIHYGANGKNPPTMNIVKDNPDSYSSVFTLDPTDPSVAGTSSVADTSPLLLIGYDPVTALWSVTLKSKNGDTGEGLQSEVYVEVSGTAQDSLRNLAATGLGPTDKPQRPTLLINHPGGFVDESEAWGLGDLMQCASVTAGDFNNDMYQDLYLVCGTAASNTENILLENLPRDGGGRAFVRVTGDGGAGGPVGLAIHDGAGTADSVVTADYDVDGFLDLFVTNGLNMFPKQHGGGNRLFHNDGNSNHWIELDLVGTKGIREATGAVVTLSANGVTQTNVKNGGYHRWSHDFTRTHFGLAQADKTDLTIQWPGGIKESYSDVASDHLYRATEGGGLEIVKLGQALPYPCGLPWPTDTSGQQINSGYEKGLYLAKDCTSGKWLAYFTSGANTQAAPPTYTGRISSTAPVTITRILPNPLPARDLLICDNNQACAANGTSKEMTFDLTVSSTNSIRAFTFLPADPSSTCITVNTPDDVKIFMGPLKRPVSSKQFYLDSLQACPNGNAVDPSPGQDDDGTGTSSNPPPASDTGGKGGGAIDIYLLLILLAGIIRRQVENYKTAR